MANEVKKEELNSVTYYTTESRGTVYTLFRGASDSNWTLVSNRKKYANKGIGTFRSFRSLKEIEQTIKGLRGIDALINKKNKYSSVENEESNNGI